MSGIVRDKYSVIFEVNLSYPKGVNLLHIMKKITLILCFLAIGFTVRSQSLIAKLKYEDAEAAYQKKDYPLAITKLNETEAILKATNPRTLYLRVMTQFKMIESGLAKDFAIIESARKLSSDYLAKYETVPNNEDKFRDIYKVSEALNSYPKTAADFNEQLAAIEAETTKNARPANTLEGLLEQFKFKLNFTVDQFLAYNPEVKEFSERKSPFSPGNWAESDAKKGPTKVYSDNGLINHYETVVTASDDLAYLQKVLKNYSDLLLKLSPTPVKATSTETYILTSDMHLSVKIDGGRVLIAFAPRKS
jgi:hypothetical protein